MNGPTECPPASDADKILADATKERDVALKSARDKDDAKRKRTNSQLETEIKEAQRIHDKDKDFPAYNLAYDKAVKKHDDEHEADKKEFEDEKDEVKTKYNEVPKVAK